MDEKMEHDLEVILYGMYKICLALTSITEMECCCYSFEEEVETAEKFVEGYERDHPERIIKRSDS